MKDSKNIKTEQDFMTELDFTNALEELGLVDTSRHYNAADNLTYYERTPVAIFFRKRSQIEGAQFDGCIDMFSNPRFEMTTHGHMDPKNLSFRSVYELLVYQLKTLNVELEYYSPEGEAMLGGLT